MRFKVPVKKIRSIKEAECYILDLQEDITMLMDCVNHLSTTITDIGQTFNSVLEILDDQDIISLHRVEDRPEKPRLTLVPKKLH
jgi:hypothetical protein